MDNSYSLEILNKELLRLTIELDSRLNNEQINHPKIIKELENKINDLEFHIDFIQ